MRAVSLMGRADFASKGNGCNVAEKRFDFFFKGTGDCGSLHCVCLLIFFYEFCLPLLGLPHHLAERTEVRLFELIYVKRSKSLFLLKGQKDQNEGQAIF